MSTVVPDGSARREFSIHFLALWEFYHQGQCLYRSSVPGSLFSALWNFLDTTSESIAAANRFWGFKSTGIGENSLHGLCRKNCDKLMKLETWEARTSRFADSAAVSQRIILFQEEYVDALKTINLDDVANYGEILFPLKACKHIVAVELFQHLIRINQNNENGTINTGNNDTTVYKQKNFCHRPFFYRVRQLILLAERCHMSPSEEANKKETDDLLIMLDNHYNGSDQSNHSSSNWSNDSHQNNNSNDNIEYYTTFFPPVTAPDLDRIFLTASEQKVPAALSQIICEYTETGVLDRDLPVLQK